MTDFTVKEQILRDNGYRYSFDRRLYVNKGSKRAFSVQFLEDHSESEIALLAQDQSSSADWYFFFNTEPSAAVQQQLSDILG